MALALNLELVLPRDTATVPLVRHILKYTLTEFGVAAHCVSDVELAVTEACANVVEHAAGDDEYEIRTSLDGDRCDIRVIDTGHGFDHASMRHLETSPESEGGRGLMLMQSLMDRIHFESEPELGTVVHLTKHLEFDIAPMTPATPVPPHD
jgi:serine/threonine-protein kinase RsbW